MRTGQPLARSRLNVLWAPYATAVPSRSPRRPTLPHWPTSSWVDVWVDRHRFPEPASPTSRLTTSASRRKPCRDCPDHPRPRRHPRQRMGSVAAGYLPFLTARRGVRRLPEVHHGDRASGGRPVGRGGIRWFGATLLGRCARGPAVCGNAGRGPCRLHEADQTCTLHTPLAAGEGWRHASSTVGRHQAPGTRHAAGPKPSPGALWARRRASGATLAA